MLNQTSKALTTMAANGTAYRTGLVRDQRDHLLHRYVSARRRQPTAGNELPPW